VRGHPLWQRQRHPKGNRQAGCQTSDSAHG